MDYPCGVKMKIIFLVHEFGETDISPIGVASLFIGGVNVKSLEIWESYAPTKVTENESASSPVSSHGLPYAASKLPDGSPSKVTSHL